MREPIWTRRRLRDRVKTALLLIAALVFAACQGAGTSASPSGSDASGMAATTISGGVEGLVADLSAAGIQSKTGASFLAEPVGGEGVIVCVGHEALHVYSFIDHEAALAASQKIDPQDPSKIGTSIVSWVGTPRFWLRDRVVVLYLGDDAATLTVLASLLGPPFAKGLPGAPPLRGPDCA